MFQVTRIEGREWGISIALGFVSIPWGSIIRLLPTKPFEWLFKAMRLIHEEALLPFVAPGREGLGGVLSNIRSGGLKSSGFLNSEPRLPQDDQRMYALPSLFLLDSDP